MDDLIFDKVTRFTAMCREDYIILAQHHRNLCMEENRWCLYVSFAEHTAIYLHAMKLLNSDPDNYMCDEFLKFSHGLELHKGITYCSLEKHHEKDWLKIGCDYNHYGDDFYNRMGADQFPIKSDAEALYHRAGLLVEKYEID